MVNKDILDFIRAQDAQGVSRFTIRHALITQGGWNIANIEEAFALIPLTPAQTVAPQQTYIAAAEPQAVVTEVTKTKGNGGILILTVILTLIGAGVALLLAFAFVPPVREFMMQCMAR